MDKCKGYVYLELNSTQTVTYKSFVVKVVFDCNKIMLYMIFKFSEIDLTFFAMTHEMNPSQQSIYKSFSYFLEIPIDIFLQRNVQD